MRSLLLALAILCGAATCEAADSFYFSNGSFSFSIGPQPRYYRPPYSYSPYSPYANPYQYRSPYSYPYNPRSPYYAPPSKYPPRHYPHSPRHEHGRRQHRGCH